MSRRITRRSFCKSVAAAAGATAAPGVPGCNLLQSFPGESPGLASDWSHRRNFYDFLIVGSGYGGAIMAARLAQSRADLTTCVLERGREWPVGSFPDTTGASLRAMRLPKLNPLGLYEFRASGNVAVLQGCGLGGTSLINANVALVPGADVFNQDVWPAGITLETLLPYFERARGVLLPRPLPQAESFLKFQALRQRAAEIDADATPLDLTINYGLDGENAFGVRQKPCMHCGDCLTGCNVGAKNTMAMNYLPLARANGAELFTRTEVEWLERRLGGAWRVHGRHFDPFGQAQTFYLDGANVVLAAGSLGSTEILLRSQAAGLSLSNRLGHGFCGNGDFFAAAYNGRDQANVLGFGNRPNHPWHRNAPGPAVIGGIRYNEDRPLPERFIVEDLDIPRGLIAQMMLTLPLLPGHDTGEGDELAELGRRLLDRPNHPYVDHNAINHTMVYIVVGHDTAQGRIFLEETGRAEIDWDPVAGREDVLDGINAELAEHARTLGARFISNPLWTLSDRRVLITAHPLGGCRMADSPNAGVVDEFGRAFAMDGSLLKGLYVADGSIIPSSLGANPFLTIAAVCERIADRIVT